MGPIKNVKKYSFWSVSCKNIQNYGVLYRNIGQILLCVTRPSRLTIWIWPMLTNMTALGPNSKSFLRNLPAKMDWLNTNAICGSFQTFWSEPIRKVGERRSTIDMILSDSSVVWKMISPLLLSTSAQSTPNYFRLQLNFLALWQIKSSPGALRWAFMVWSHKSDVWPLIRCQGRKPFQRIVHRWTRLPYSSTQPLLSSWRPLILSLSPQEDLFLAFAKRL